MVSVWPSFFEKNAICRPLDLLFNPWTSGPFASVSPVLTWWACATMPFCAVLEIKSRDVDLLGHKVYQLTCIPSPQNLAVSEMLKHEDTEAFTPTWASSRTNSWALLELVGCRCTQTHPQWLPPYLFKDLFSIMCLWGWGVREYRHSYRLETLNLLELELEAVVSSSMWILWHACRAISLTFPYLFLKMIFI